MTRDAQIEQIETIVSACLRHGGFAHGFWVGLCPAHRAEITALAATPPDLQNVTLDTRELALIEADTARGITDCSTPVFQRVRNIVEQLTAAEQQIAALTTALAAAKAEIAVSDQLLADRQRILDAYPCPQHGPCVPHVLALLARLSPPRAETPPNVPTVPPNRELRETGLRAAPVVAPAPAAPSERPIGAYVPCWCGHSQADHDPAPPFDCRACREKHGHGTTAGPLVRTEPTAAAGTPPLGLCCYWCSKSIQGDPLVWNVSGKPGVSIYFCRAECRAAWWDNTRDRIRR